ncbi:MAG: beta-ketoacyl-ACP synthase II [Planctomycetota bacterium]|nr:beta-ketoacyl-ACP synthase II [Planctomycetota bacterium]MDI6787571.1 beta-ketoacyl-ACP synthase II [Planctomycetota bacterium]
MQKRVVITGLGAICSVGLTSEETWQSLLAGKSGAAKIQAFDTTGFDVNFACEVKNFKPEDYFPAPQAKRLDRFAQFALASAIQSVKDANIDFANCNPHRIGVIVGSGIGGFVEFGEQHTRLLQKGPSRVSPFTIPKVMVNSAPGQIAIHYGLKGPNFSCASACASSNHAIGIAFKLLQQGIADIIITGGSEAAITPLGMAGFASLKALSTRNDTPEKASRPFDKNRDGFVMGEGSGIFIMETLEHALARSAKIYAEMLGFGMNDDGYHITAPDPEGEGASLTMKLALDDAGLKPEDVFYINAHGTSTPYNDLTETKAIKKLFGEHSRKLAINSTKSMVGHLLGGSGAIELVATVLSIRDSIVHPTINYETPDPECDLDYVPNTARKVDVNIALSNSFGFGGHNATVVVGKYKP